MMALLAPHPLMQNEISSFVKEALGKGLSRTDIAGALGKAGWPKDEIDVALGLYADVPFPVPVPRRKPYLSAREAFIYLLLFVCLYISAYNFGSLLFSFINTWFPDAVQGYYGDNSGMRFSIASLIVAFPLYLWLSSLTQKAIAKDKEKRGSKIRKWLTYITLFVAASVIIGDTIALLFSLLGGELTLRFTLKVLVIMFIAGLIFGYYLWDLRKDETEA
jgi:hypothetical protein